jgi:hypothetical protein
MPAFPKCKSLSHICNLTRSRHCYNRHNRGNRFSYRPCNSFVGPTLLSDLHSLDADRETNSIVGGVSSATSADRSKAKPDEVVQAPAARMCLPEGAKKVCNIMKAWCGVFFRGSILSAGENRCPKCEGEMVQRFVYEALPPRPGPLSTGSGSSRGILRQVS